MFFGRAMSAEESPPDANDTTSGSEASTSKDERMRASVIEEFVSSEMKYLHDLQTLKRLYIAPLSDHKQFVSDARNLEKVCLDVSHAVVCILMNSHTYMTAGASR